MLINISQKMEFAGKHPSGFDYLRLILATSVVLMHGTITSYGQDADIALWASPLRPLLRLILPMFFALSGFLVAGSIYRTTSLPRFLFYRVIRIYPALIFEVIVSALLIGPILTTLSRTEYFTSPLFFTYLLNATGDIHYNLPGVFAKNPFPNVVNAQLWTVPFELGCYIAISIMWMAGVQRYRWISIMSTAALILGYVGYRVIKIGFGSHYIAGGVPGAMLIAAFLSGVAIYCYRDTICWNRLLVPCAGIFSCLLLLMPFGDYICAPVIAYFTVALGVTNVPRISIIKSADYSYGIFLYGFVVQQTISYLLPIYRFWLVNIAVSLPITFAVAICSWYLIEKPILRLKMAKRQ